ncbi:nuclear transport factor 2 family protein [Mycolicibacterium vaccae]|uniref:nuclear transport factor 2 family protein n=1 Tax=Mycolicibacterium vaccae TaxID=1810 RepID=UPI003CEA250E
MTVIDAQTLAEVADALFAAIERGDIAAVDRSFAPDVRVRKTGDRRDNDHTRSVKIINWFVTASTQRRYEVLDRQLFPGGFVQQHMLHATAHNGTTIAMRVCIVIKVGDDGLITRVDEYFDPAEIGPLIKQQT